MIDRDQIRGMLDHPVYDAEGSKVGETKHVFFDDATGEPEWATVKTGMFGTNESFVPLRDASMVEDHLEVPYPKSTVRGAPTVSVDEGGHLSESEEQRLYDHYGIDWHTASGTGETAGYGTGEGAVHAGGETAYGTGESAPYGIGGDAAAEQPAADRSLQDTSGDSAMTRSEERLQVGTERREAGRARLHKYVVTEEEEVTVPLRKERARVEREPITAENRDVAMAGPDIAEADYEVVLHEERPVAETRVEPVERVRLTAEEVTEEETVRGRVRKERIEAETDERDTP